MIDGPETTYIDYLFLELSQFTQAKTGREISLQNKLDAAELKLHAACDLISEIADAEFPAEFQSDCRAFKVGDDFSINTEKMEIEEATPCSDE